MNTDDAAREQLVQLLKGRNAHMTFEDAVKEFPMEHINTKPPNVLYTPWHLIEHLRIAQWDIMEFVRDPEHVSPPWPEGYWPPQDAVATEIQWKETVKSFKEDLASVKAIALDESLELAGEISHAPGYTYLREVLLVADHNAYHVGELAILRQVLGAW